MTSGRAALLCFAAVIVTAGLAQAARHPVRRLAPGAVALTLAGLHLAVGHIEGVDYYLNTPGKRPLWIAFTLSWVLLIVYVRAFKPWHMRKTPYRVVDVKQGKPATPGRSRVQADGHAGLRFQPGAIRLAHAAGLAVCAEGASVFFFFQRRATAAPRIHHQGSR